RVSKYSNVERLINAPHLQFRWTIGNRQSAIARYNRRGAFMAHQLIEKQVLYDGKKVRLEIHHLENDETGNRIKKEVCAHPGAVVVLPFLDEKNILVIRTKRYAVGQILIELP